MAAKTKLPRGIRLRGSRYYWSKQVNGQRLYGSSPDLTQSIMEMATAQITTETSTQSNITLQQAIDQVEANIEATLAHNTYKAALTMHKIILSHINPATILSDINTQIIDDFIRQLKTEGKKPAYINQALIHISRLYTTGLDYGWIDKKPKIHWLKNPNKKIRFFTLAEEHQLLSNLPRPYQDIIAILIDTGLRVNELLTLQPDNINLTKKQITLWHTKTNSTRTIPLTDRAELLLKQALPDLYKDIRYSKLLYYVDKARTAIGLGADKACTIHTCRHTCASRLIQNHIPVSIIQRWLGHSSIQTTMRYSHLTDDELLEAVDVLNKIN